MNSSGVKAWCNILLPTLSQDEAVTPVKVDVCTLRMKRKAIAWEGGEATTGNSREATDENPSPQSLRPARGWRVAADGTVILTAQATTTDVSASNLLSTPHCRAFSEK
ncbi:MAG: hypothetical protein SW833_15760 [Cyanobacteriota bacterium]|nr:hypothetical protein [Cyanobacteriota bacterium]